MSELHGSCEQNQFQCDNGECIAGHAMCDGALDCADNSDEIVRYCAASPCTKYAFRCGYGACIPGGRKCDGKMDCADGSDESALLCNYSQPVSATTSRPQSPSRPVYQPAPNYNTIPSTSKPQAPVYVYEYEQPSDTQPLAPASQYEQPQYTQPTTRPVPQYTQPPRRPVPQYTQPTTRPRPQHTQLTTRPRPQHTQPTSRPRPQYTQPPVYEPQSPSGGDSMTCRVDNIPTDADAYYNGQMINYGTYVPNFSTVEYRCIENHAIDGNNTNRCVNGQWLHPKTSCQPKCDPKAIEGITILANCYRREDNREVNVNCRQPLDPGTYVTINCKNGYEQGREFHKRVTCGADGRWSPEPGGCTQTCGEQGSIGKPFIVGGYESNISEVPWHVGVYMKAKMSGEFEHICGGTIISAKLVVSAMHCFWDPIESRAHNVKQFQIAVGKTRRALTDREDYPVQMIGVERLLFDEGYAHEQTYYVNDFVVVLLDKYIEFKTYVVPACIKWDLSYDEIKVAAGLKGKVAGWGLTQSGGQTSPVLRAIEMPTIGREDCIANSPESFRNFITFDKFCAGYLNGVSVCEGDSGGGMVFPETVGRKTVYYLRGLVSVGVRLQNSCDNYRYATFTNVNKYTELMRQHFYVYQPKL